LNRQSRYHPSQIKKAILELDPNSKKLEKASLLKFTEDGKTSEVLSGTPEKWGSFLRYDYAIFDFSSVKEPGIYLVTYGKTKSYPFSIKSTIFSTGVWHTCGTVCLVAPWYY